MSRDPLEYETPADLCGPCGGSGSVHDGDSWGSCPECKGVGRVEDTPEPLSSYGSQEDMARHLREAFNELQARCARMATHLEPEIGENGYRYVPLCDACQKAMSHD